MVENQEKISIESLLEHLNGRDRGIDCTGLSGAAKAYLAMRIHKEHGVPLVVLVPSPKDAEVFLDDLSFFSDQAKQPVIYFPPYNILPFKDLAYHSETAARRIRALYLLTVSAKPLITVTTVEALLHQVVPKAEIGNYAELIMAGEEIDREQLIRKLVSGGYTHSALVEEPGDFCVRGGILDIFSPLYSDPLRIELFGEQVESIRFFSNADQRTKATVSEAVILPAKEAILKTEHMDEIIGRIRQQASELEMPVTKTRNLIDGVKKTGTFPGVESLTPLLYPEMDSFFDYVSDQALYMLTDPVGLDKAAKALEQQSLNNFLSACDKGRLCVPPDKLFLKWSRAREIMALKKPLTLKMLAVSPAGLDDQPSNIEFEFYVKDNSTLSLELRRRREKGLLAPLANWINHQKQKAMATCLVCTKRRQADRLKFLLEPYNIQLGFAESFSDVARKADSVYACLGRISAGFVWSSESLAIITEDEIFGTRQRRPIPPERKVRTELLGLEDLKQDDLVVHAEHGIGQYQGLVKLKFNGSASDFLLVVYQNDDKLYLPVDRMSMIQKYMGVDGIEPVLDKMGGRSWERVKAKVKRSAEKIAGELLKLYAERKVSDGFGFQPVDSEIRDFVAGFPYEETADQLNAIEDVWQDMQAPIPMDRLVCGDVGYGKTEVALRASLMAVFNDKQVAVLVPTTVLAEQHFATFCSRFEGYPVQVACLSRFRSRREQRQIIDDLKNGRVDIVVGTHRLLQKDVAFKNLGLFVIDEEQRFGVRHKEKLKKMRSTVDVLALTATPIPRTLHLSLMGVRDISVISTPPEHRRSIITYITEFDDAVIVEAVRKELARNGQIFFVHNNIHKIWAVAKYLQKLVPEVRLDVAHGRMDENDLETVMLRFVAREIDMLVCTTIIESGLDIPSANTILINRADRFGLAQIYQLRGRVGRVDEQAYAYLFIPHESSLSKDAQKRLKVLMEHSDLGSGFQIAMSDLKIRGGGTILGASQSGHIAAVGYDMFLKLMESAMAELKGEPLPASLEPEINIVISASIPESYMPDIDQRLWAYRRLAKMTELYEITDFKSELIDRFGALTADIENLLLKIMLKVLSIKAGVKRLDLADNQLTISFSRIHQRTPAGVADMIADKAGQFEFSEAGVLTARLNKGPLNSLLFQTKNILKEIAQSVNNR